MALSEREEAAEPSARVSLPPDPDAPRAQRVHRALWLLIPLIAVAELVGHEVILARVPEEADWDRAAEFVAAELEPGADRIVAAPDWADPLVREHLGDRMTFESAAPSDNATFEHLFELSIRGHRSAHSPEREPDDTHRFGRVLVNRWDLGPSTVRYDFVENVRSAVVEKVVDGAAENCPWQNVGMSRNTGLSQGHVIPAERFSCQPRGGAFWVGTTVMEDLDYQPRYCIYQHPQGEQPIRATFRNIPLGDRLVLYAGLYNRHERAGDGAPIRAKILVDGSFVGQMVHRDLDGWKSVVLPTRSAEEVAADPDARGDVTIEVTTDHARWRSFCWTATIRAGEREGEL